ncbi:hypothetical protein V8F06_001464 [Rhypophila decipiens]
MYPYLSTFLAMTVPTPHRSFRANQPVNNHPEQTHTCRQTLGPNRSTSGSLKVEMAWLAAEASKKIFQPLFSNCADWIKKSGTPNHSSITASHFVPTYTYIHTAYIYQKTTKPELSLSTYMSMYQIKYSIAPVLPRPERCHTRARAGAYVLTADVFGLTLTLAQNPVVEWQHEQTDREGLHQDRPATTITAITHTTTTTTTTTSYMYRGRA